MSVQSMAIAVLLVSFLVMILLRFPIAYAVALSSLLCLLSQGLPLTTICQQMVKGISSFSLMAVPFFILAGNIMAEGGISDRLISFFELLLKRLPGRLSCICVVASGFFGAISGSNPATVAAIGGICAPKMIEKGYSREDAAAIAASSGTLGVVIPPSIPMVTGCRSGQPERSPT